MALKWHYLPVIISVAVVCLFDVSGGVGLVVHRKQGSSALLKCNVALPSEGPTATLYVVEWVRQGYDTPVLIKFGTYVPRIHPHYEDRISLSGATDLLVVGLKLDDGGWYECRVLLLNKPSDETRNGSWTLLSVTAPPVFSETPSLVTEVFLSRPITLKCVAHGNPPPIIKWYKDGVLMNQTGNVKVLNGSLSFSSVKKDTAGHYQCHASNSEGNEICSTQLRVKGPPAIIIPPTNTILNLSQNALLQCQAEADPPNMTYVWLREGENVYHIESLKTRVKVMVDGTLLISHLTPGDSGNYTCMPTNGLPVPPTASAILTVQYPAQVTQMPEWTFLPTGMRGVISCPLSAEPQLLRVAWTKDGKALDLRSYPGWALTAEGSIVIATTNDDATGVYTCTPYNSYGTMGQSEPTTVILQDPPSLRVSPQSEYRQQVGQTLLIPCQALGDPPPTVKWAKPGASSSYFYSITSNGSLLLQPLGKEHHGEWECHVINRVATIKATTSVSVLGTSPHVVSSVSVEAEIDQANISWEPGFDGGYKQTFSVWLKCLCADGELQEWKSILAYSSSLSLLVTGLLPSTEYQFRVMAHNKLGSGPFSEIGTARTLDKHPVGSRLEPPTLLSFNQSSEGVYLWWAAPQLPIDGFLLQSRLKEGEWLNLDVDISANKTDMLIKGLQKNSNYELRLLSRSGQNLSMPSRSVNISTLGMEEYLTSPQLLEFAPHQLLVGIIGGMGFLCLVFLLVLAMLFVISQRRSQRQEKYREEIYGGPDSVLKQNLLPPCSLSSSSSSFGKSSCSEYHGQRQQNLPCTKPSHSSLPETHLHRGPLGSPVCSVELIYRGADGRFMLKPYEEISAAAPATQTIPRPSLLQISDGADNSMVQNSQSLYSYEEKRRHPPFVLSVDLTTCGSDSCPSGTVQAMPEQHSLQRFPSQFKEQELSNQPLDQSSLISECSSSTLLTPSERYKTLNCSSVRSAASTLVLQMEHEREQGNLSHCLRLAREREELERELRRYTLDWDCHVNHHKSAGSLRVEQSRNVENIEEMGTDIGALQGKQLSSRGHCVSNNPSVPGIRASSCIVWEASPMMAARSLVPAQVSQERGVGLSKGSRCSQMSNQHKSQSLEQGEHQKSHFKEQRQRCTMTEGASACVDNESFYTTLENVHYTLKGSQKNARTYNLSQHCIVPKLSHSVQKQLDRTAERSETGCTGDYVEMCVDEPEVQAEGPLTRSMLDHSQETQDYHRPILYQISKEIVEERVGGFRWDLEKLSQSSRTLPSVGGQSPTLQHKHHMASKHINHHKSAPILNSKMNKEVFLTPDAWINSLQNSHSHFVCRPDSVVQGSHLIPNQETNTPFPLKIQLQHSQHQGISKTPASFTADHQHSEPCSSPSLPLRGTSWSSSYCHSPVTERSSSESSGRGSLDHAAEESDKDEAGLQDPRRGSVDENYEWDSHYVTKHFEDLKAPVSRRSLEGEFLSKGRGKVCAEDDSRLALNQEKKGRGNLCAAPSVLTTGSEESPLAQEILHNSTSYPDPEPDAVMF
uniref:Immunoglobulin superfamily, member 9a n=1 Tax=Electrophorus electricus TaxID=8005 RepID=A0A4W4FJN6_ELEEL